jgi:hypothetical protein
MLSRKGNSLLCTASSVVSSTWYVVFDGKLKILISYIRFFLISGPFVIYLIWIFVFQAITGVAIVARCERIRDSFRRSLFLIQNMVPPALANQVS